MLLQVFLVLWRRTEATKTMSACRLSIVSGDGVPACLRPGGVLIFPPNSVTVPLLHLRHHCVAAISVYAS